MAVYSTRKALILIFNISKMHEEIPDGWKSAYIVPILINGSVIKIIIDQLVNISNM